MLRQELEYKKFIWEVPKSREREKWGSKTGKGKMPIQGVLISELSLWAPELCASGDLWEAA